MFRKRAPARAAAPGVGNARCTATSCRRRDATPCSYVDKRARVCPTAWCPAHVADVAGIAFCRRHASTMNAIEGSEMVAGLPDLDNRAPSLVGWVARDLDAPVRELLVRQSFTATATLVSEPVRLTLVPGDNARRWTKSWKVLDNRAVLNRVSIEVDEADDRSVAARVDSELIGHGVPPWIEHRLAGHRVPPAVDAAERREFADAMARSIELVVTGQESVRRP